MHSWVPWEWRAGRVWQWWSHGYAWRRAATSNQDGKRERWTWGRPITQNHITSVLCVFTVKYTNALLRVSLRLAVLHLRGSKKCLLFTGTGETWWREAARCGWQCPCSGARGRPRGPAWRRSIGSCPSTGTEAQLKQNKVKTEEITWKFRIVRLICFSLIRFYLSNTDQILNDA